MADARRDEPARSAAGRMFGAPAGGGDTSLIDAFGGVRGMVDMTVPGLVFVVIYTVARNLTAACVAAFGLAVLLAVVRLFRRETIKHAFGGVLGVGIGAFVAYKSGNAANFYLPSMIYGLVLLVVYAVSNLVRWPLLGVLLGPVLGENLSWRERNPERARAYAKATWVWVALFALRAAVLFPVYFLAHSATWLGALKIGLGVPPWLVAIYLSWLILSKAPPPIKVTDRDSEDLEQADAERRDAEQEVLDRVGEELGDSLLAEVDRARAEAAEQRPAPRD